MFALRKGTKGSSVHPNTHGNCSKISQIKENAETSFVLPNTLMHNKKPLACVIPRHIFFPLNMYGQPNIEHKCFRIRFMKRLRPNGKVHFRHFKANKII